MHRDVLVSPSVLTQHAGKLPVCMYMLICVVTTVPHMV
jgi:hypothetical protein